MKDWAKLDIDNFGDRLNTLIPELVFGVKVRETSLFPPTDCVLSTGSLLAIFPHQIPATVWGSGFEPIYGASQPQLSEWDFRAVRGPLTAVACGLDSGIPQGDPAILLSRGYTPKPTTREKLLVTHWQCGEDYSLDGFQTVNTRVTQDGVLPLVDRIAGAEFVLTDALHGAIVAQSYGVPWAWCPLSQTRALTKWADWFAWLGLPPTPVALDESQALAWWNDTRPQTPDLQPLIDSFPV